MKAWGITDVGFRRRENQDSYAYEAFGAPHSIVAVVCDGMGGVNGGRLASTLAVSTYLDTLHLLAKPEMTVEQVDEMQRFCIAQANRAVFERSLEREDYRGMGTTLVSAVVSRDVAVVANVGDSRAYHIGAHGIRRVSKDHSVVAEMIASGEITPEQARTHPNRNLITRALGPDAEILCDTYVVPFAQGDSLLLCTDGVTGTARDEELLRTVRDAADGEAALALLLELVKSRGAPDNVTAVLIRNDGSEGVSAIG
ncbi:MAG: Stp1/IreP family PP2C-type Ser/Thr phosphatase [Oscillospiraceae bacterium]|nr:Stp1/IreP family PP2C-type Ser/Thr phosphatase [Oscillospiraceae bacterium]